MTPPVFLLFNIRGIHDDLLVYTLQGLTEKEFERVCNCHHKEDCSAIEVNADIRWLIEFLQDKEPLYKWSQEDGEVFGLGGTAKPVAFVVTGYVQLKNEYREGSEDARILELVRKL